jgi:hypothetical protein
MRLYHSIARHADCLRSCSHRFYVTPLEARPICVAAAAFVIAAFCIAACAAHEASP